MLRLPASGAGADGRGWDVTAGGAVVADPGGDGADGAGVASSGCMPAAQSPSRLAQLRVRRIFCCALLCFLVSSPMFAGFSGRLHRAAALRATAGLIGSRGYATDSDLWIEDSQVNEPLRTEMRTRNAGLLGEGERITLLETATAAH